MVRAEARFVERQRPAINGDALLVTFQAVQQTAPCHRIRYRRWIVLAQGKPPDFVRLTSQWFAGGEIAAGVCQAAEVMVNGSSLDRIFAVPTRQDAKRPAIGTFSFVEAARVLTDDAIFVEEPGDLLMAGAEMLLAFPNGVLNGRRCVVVAAQFAQRPAPNGVSTRDQGAARVRVEETLHGVQNVFRLPRLLFGLLEA